MRRWGPITSDPLDPRDGATYPITDAAHYLGLPGSTVRAWTLGQHYVVAGKRKLARPLFRAAERNPPTLSFWNLVEAYVLASIRRRHGVSLQKVRRALGYVEERLETRRPLIEQDFLTDGVDLFIEKYASLINVSRGGQTHMRDVLIASLRRIDRDPRGLAERLYPWWRSPDDPKTIQIDPRLSFGRPVVTGTGVPTEALAERWRAGDDIAHLAQDYGLKQEQVESALRWEARAVAA